MVEVVRYKVIPIEVALPCECQEGEMVGSVATKPPIQSLFFHKCNACSLTEWIKGKKYSYIEYVRTGVHEGA